MDHDAYIRRETLVSIAINAALSALFFVLVFGSRPSVPLTGWAEWVIDFAPQGFMVGLMSMLVPGAITAARLRAGRLQPAAAARPLPRSLLLRSLLAGIVCGAAGVLLMAGLVRASGACNLAIGLAGAIKVTFGAALAALVTPWGLRRTLSSA